MPSYTYKAIDETGSPVAGALTADSPEDARAQLRRMRLFPEHVESAAARETGRLIERLPIWRGRDAAHVAVFTRQAAVLLASGVQAVEALHVLSRQSEHAALGRVLAEIAERVGAGGSLAESLRAWPRFFDRSYVGMVASGERSGTLDIVFARLGDFLERRRAMQSRVSTALIYPGLLLAMVVGLMFFLSGFVVPSIRPLLEMHKRPLPFASWLLFRLGDLVHGYGWVALLVLVGGIAALAWTKRTERGRAALDALALRIPMLGPLWAKSLVARFTMSFATLLRTGVPAVEALEVLRDVTPNVVFARETERIRTDVLEGKEISSRMRSGGVFPPMVGYMVAVGERSGSLAEVLEQVASAYAAEVDAAGRRLLAVLEPALVLAMAAVVGFIAMSLMVTILELSHI